MRRTLLMIAAVALLLTQCRKPVVEYPTAGPANENMVSMTVTVGHGGKTDINGNTGAITWSENDKLYVGDGSKYIGYLTLQGAGGSATGTFTGTVSAAAGDYTFGLYYLGSGDYTTFLTAGTSTYVDIPFGAQKGRLDRISEFHIGYGTATGKVEGGSVILAGTDPVTMTSKVAIAYFEFKKDDGSDYTDPIFLSGEHIYSWMTVKFNGAEDGKFTGTEGQAGKPIVLLDEISQRYVMLVPTGTVEETLEFGFDEYEGTTKFYKGIEANKFYCVGAGEPIEVTVARPKPKFSVGADTKVEFAPGNLYCDGSSWQFEANQWDFRTYEGNGSCINGVYNASSGTPSNHWGLFGWSVDGIPYGTCPLTDLSIYIINFVEWGTAPGLPDAGEGKSWCTLTKDEWAYLLTTRTTVTTGLPNVSSRYAKVTVNGVSGMLLFPDSFAWTSAMGTAPTSTNTLGAAFTTGIYTAAQFTEQEKYGAVFLPAAGIRDGTDVYGVGSGGSYWSSTTGVNVPDFGAYGMSFGQDVVDVDYFPRHFGYSVRLVRSAS